jgi:conjugal transfer mating pair stabilization protein TraN
MHQLRGQRKDDASDTALGLNMMRSQNTESRGGATLHRSAIAGAILALCCKAAAGETFAPGACSLEPNSQSCVDQTPCKTDSGGQQICLSTVSPLPKDALAVPQTCWQYGYKFACASLTNDSCTQYEKNPACSVLSSSCQDHMQPSGVCDSWLFTYQCETAPAQTTSRTVCTSGIFDSSGFAPLPVLNKNMPTVAVAEEMIREGQLYSDKGSKLFAGVSETCRKGYGGIKNCCKSSPGAKSNSQTAQVAFGAAAQVVKYAGEQAIDWASPYVFDAMYNYGLWTDGMTAAFQTGGDSFGTSAAAGGFSVGAYGFTYTTVSTQGGGLLGGNIELFGNSDMGFVEFNPYVFAAVVVITALEQMASCTSEEQLLSQHKGASLSVFEEETCTSKLLGSCSLFTDRYCSFNSVLAKIIDTQGKAQLGLSSFDCSGMTIQQVGQIDFSKIDFSEFTQSLTQQAQQHTPTSTAIGSAYKPIVSGMSGGSAQNRTMKTGTNVVGAAPGPTLPPNSVLPQYPKPASAPAGP